jgi:hypothetical protein
MFVHKRGHIESKHTIALSVNCVILQFLIDSNAAFFTI